MEAVLKQANVKRFEMLEHSKTEAKSSRSLNMGTNQEKRKNWGQSQKDQHSYGDEDGQPVVAHAANTIYVSHVALQQTDVSGHMLMQASDLRMLRPEADQNTMRGHILISVTSAKHRVNDIMCLLWPFLTLNLVGQGVIRTVSTFLQIVLVVYRNSQQASLF